MPPQHRNGAVGLWVSLITRALSLHPTQTFLSGPRTLCNACGLVYAKLVSFLYVDFPSLPCNHLHRSKRELEKIPRPKEQKVQTFWMTQDLPLVTARTCSPLAALMVDGASSGIRGGESDVSSSANSLAVQLVFFVLYGVLSTILLSRY
jgi:hypothetical protein